MKDDPDYPKIKSSKIKKIENVEEDFDFGAFLGCDDNATEEEIDQMWENQMC
jgi:hypothetical protein